MSDEVVDPQVVLREKCAEGAQCRPLREQLEECTKRVNSKPGTSENCEEELFDFLACVDKCSATELFNRLK